MMLLLLPLAAFAKSGSSLEFGDTTSYNYGRLSGSSQQFGNTQCISVSATRSMTPISVVAGRRTARLSAPAIRPIQLPVRFRHLIGKAPVSLHASAAGHITLGSESQVTRKAPRLINVGERVPLA